MENSWTFHKKLQWRDKLKKYIWKLGWSLNYSVSRGYIEIFKTTFYHLLIIVGMIWWWRSSSGELVVDSVSHSARFFVLRSRERSLIFLKILFIPFGLFGFGFYLYLWSSVRFSPRERVRTPHQDVSSSHTFLLKYGMFDIWIKKSIDMAWKDRKNIILKPAFSFSFK